MRSFSAAFVAAATSLSLVAASPMVTIQARQMANYPPPDATPPRSMTPQPWIDALNQAVAQGKIPNIPPSLNREGPLAYPAGTNPADPSVCSWSWNQCQGPHDIHSAPQGQVAMNFDDGPAAGTDQLLGFLQQNNQKASHFLIGSAISWNPDAVRRMAASPLHHLAVHTWSHPPYISSLSNEDIVAELGWTMQIITDVSGGRVPKYWRAPQGDLDNRVRAIAENVFGLTHVSWNGDSGDWRLPSSATFDQVSSNIQQGIQSAVSSGQGVILLEHELRPETVNAFIQVTWPLIHQLNLQPRTVPDLGSGSSWYFNAQDNQAAVSQRGILPSGGSGSNSSSSTTTSSAPSSSASSASTTTQLSTLTTSVTAAPSSTSLPSFPQQQTTTITRPGNQGISTSQPSGALPAFAAGGWVAALGLAASLLAML